MLAGPSVAIASLALAAGVAPTVATPATAPAETTAQPADPAPAAAPKKPVYGPVLPAPVRKPTGKAAGTSETCAQIRADAPSRDIIVCAQQGYRLNPDVMEAKREAHSGGPPRRPENYKYNNCAVVGPMGCMGQNQPMINLIYAATMLGTMMDRLSKGQEIGSLFKTTPTPNEYQLYVAAKHRREAREAEAAAAAKAKAAAAAQVAKAAQTAADAAAAATPTK